MARELLVGHDAVAVRVEGRPRLIDDLLRHIGVPRAHDLEFGRIVASEIEAPNILANMVPIKWMRGSTKR